MVHVQFSGNANAWDARVQAAFEQDFNRRDFLGMVEVELAYTAGRGYQITRATIHVSGVGVGAEHIPPPEFRDYTAEARAVLERMGAPLV